MEEIFDTEYTIGTRKGTAEYDSFSRSPKGTTHRRVFDEFMARDEGLLTNTLEEGVENAIKGKYAFVYIPESVYAISNNCELKELPQIVNKMHNAMAWNKHLPHRHFFNYFLNKMVETGQVDRIGRKYITQARKDCESSGEFFSMGFENVLSAFCLILFGITAGTIGLLAELCFKMICK
eukprot:GFUD01131155.1.p1 GENE.GFUD01131155.1~~GFUD01131155.1.p1  ORF type:complete len:204 (+),score=21.62 GFUD01131155.1:76-612(+)